MRTKRVMSAVAVATIAGLVVTACGSGGDSADESSEIRLSLGEPKNLIPPNIGETEGGEVARLVYTGLYDYANDGSLIPRIADGQPTSEDNKVWTIKIKPGYTFQNGEKITAETFKKSWDYAVYGPNANNGSYFFTQIAGFADTQSGADPDGDGPKEAPEPKSKELSGVEVIDDSTLQVTLEEPWVIFPALLGYTAFYPLADECLENIEACNEVPIGNGPFQIDGKWEHNTSIKLKRWDGYIGEDKPSYERLSYKILTGQATAWPDFEAGTLDIAAPTPDKYADAKAKYSDVMIEADSPSTWSLGFPVYDDVFSDVKVRRAFSKAIDRQGIIDAIYQGRGTPLDSFAPSMIPGSIDGSCADCTLDIEGAKQLLADSSWPEGKKLELWINSGSTGEKILKAIGDQLTKNLGIAYEMKTLEWPEFLQKKSDQELTGPFFTGWAPDYAETENYMAPLYGSNAGDGSDNDFGFYNAEFERLLDEGNTAPDVETARQKYNEAERVLAEQLPTAPLFSTRTSTVIGDRIDFDSVDRNPILGTINLVALKLK